MKALQKIKLVMIAAAIVALASCSGSKKGGKGCDCPGFGKVHKTERHA